MLLVNCYVMFSHESVVSGAWKCHQERPGPVLGSVLEAEKKPTVLPQLHINAANRNKSDKILDGIT